MKKISKIILFGAFVLGSLTIFSCDDKDNATGASILDVSQDVVGTIDIPFANVTSTDEANEDKFTYTITLSKIQAVDVHIYVSQVAGTADENDFSYEHDILIPANTLSVSSSIKITKDVSVEGVEDFTLQIGDNTTSNAVIAPKTVTMAINNYLSNELELVFNYNKDFSISGNPFSLCGIKYDLDFIVLNSANVDMGLYGAATANCPEKLKLNITTLPNDTYTIIYDLFSAGDFDGVVATIDGVNTVFHDPFLIPLSVDYIRAGGITAGIYTPDTANVPRSTDASGSKAVLKVKVLDGVFTILDYDGFTLASGRQANQISKIIEANHKRRRS